MRLAWTQVTVTAIGCITLIMLGFWPLIPPSPKENPPQNEFDISRALAHVRAIATRPHPNGSAENARVREYLLEQLRSLDLHPQVASGAVAMRRTSALRTVHNIVARTPAKTTEPASIMLAAHYDSVMAGPGAADDAAAVAAILETLRILKHEGWCRRPIDVLLTDGEELGMLGARHWEQQFEVAPSAGATGDQRPLIVLNFEARGVTGPSLMFETSPANLGLVRLFAKSSPHPLGSSLSYDIYRLMPNDTDFTIFKRRVPGMNFAFIGGYWNYHRPTDDLEHLDRRSLFQHGQNALACARALADLDEPAMTVLRDPRQPLAVYFNAPGLRMIVYSQHWIWPLAAAQFLVTGLAFRVAAKRKSISLLGILEASARMILSALAGFWTIHLLNTAVTTGRAVQWFNEYIELCFAVVIALCLVCALLWRRRANIADLGAVALVLWSVLSIAVNIWVPGASYLLTWPALFASVTMLMHSGRRAIGSRVPGAIILILGAAPLLLLWPATIYLCFTALTLRLAAVVALLLVIVTWLLFAPLAAWPPQVQKQ